MDWLVFGMMSKSNADPSANYADYLADTVEANKDSFTEDELKEILDKLAKGGEYGEVLRAKGIVTPAEGEWFHFDLVPEETELRRGAADYTGRICVIGANLNEDKLKELFHV